MTTLMDAIREQRDQSEMFPAPERRQRVVTEPSQLDGYQEWLDGAECPWVLTFPGKYRNTRNDETFEQQPGQSASGVLTTTGLKPE